MDNEIESHLTEYKNNILGKTTRTSLPVKSYIEKRLSYICQLQEQKLLDLINVVICRHKGNNLSSLRTELMSPPDT